MTRSKSYAISLLTGLVALGIGREAAAQPFNSQPDYQTNAFGYYYEVTGGLFPTGNIPNGDNASGGTFRFITDDPGWGVPVNAWQKDDFYAQNSSVAMTFKNGASIVYDNNGIETNTFGAYYTTVPGSVVAYSMPNNYDLTYAGYFKLDAATTITQLTGYFAGDGTGSDPFQFNSPSVAYTMNIWSNVSGDLLPVNTGGFDGDVFSSSTTPGTFSISDAGVVRVDSNNVNDPIYRLDYTLDQPITLEAGTYWFSHGALLLPSVPEPSSLALCGMGALGLACSARARRKGRLS